MSRTTQEWSTLLDGTSSGNWGVGAGGVEVFAVTDHSRSFVADAGSHLLSRQGEALTEARKDAALIAAAPEAVAEVVRLRRELEAQAAAYQYMANQIEATASQAGMVGRPIMAENYAERAKDLTRILNQEEK